MEKKPQNTARVTPDIVLNARRFQEHWFKSRKLTARTALLMPSLVASMALDYQELFNQIKFRHPDKKWHPLGHKLLEQALEEYIDLKFKEELTHAADDLLTEAEDLTELTRWVTAVTGAADPKHIAVVAHWIWAVKRKATGQPAVHHIMPILYGPQGGGKTIALERLIGPMSRYRLATSMAQLNDERTFSGLASNYIVLFDELQGAERTDMNALKKQITTVENSYRKLHTHIVFTVPQLCSFIGATNKPVAENFSDSTGMRRFWEIKTSEKLDWDSISTINYKALWQGVDETKERGYVTGETLDQVSKSQQAMVVKESWELFMEDMLLVPNTAEIVELEHKFIYMQYVLWMGNEGYNQKLPSQTLSNRLGKHLQKVHKKNDSGQTKTFFKLNANSPLLAQADNLNIIPIQRRG